MLRRSASCAVLLVMAAAPALAQGDPAAIGHMAAANQLGILEYCLSEGNVGADTVSAEKDVISRMPVSSVSTSSAEALGKQGTFAAPNGQQMTLASMASKQNTTVAALCKQIGSSTTQADAAYKQNGMTAGGMPSMPHMPAMPSMPSMPGGMPSMPGGMPSMGNMPGASGTVPK
jgi:hypothetical protein